MKIAVLPGDGIGPEVTAQAVKVLQRRRGQASPLELTEAPIGRRGVDAAGDPLPAATLRRSRARPTPSCSARAGMPGDESHPVRQRPGASLLRLRKELGLFANFRPAFLFPELIGASTLKPEVIEGLDLMILRELTGDALLRRAARLRHQRRAASARASTPCATPSPRSSASRMSAFRTARTRRRKLCSVDKANVLETMQLWREVVTRVGRDYPDVELSHLFVDAAAMQLMRAPRSST